MENKITKDDCLDLAYEALKQSGCVILDSDVQELAESISGQIADWFGDWKHLTKNK